MYLRETKRTNRDGSVVAYLQLAHSERHPDTGVPAAKVIHNFGRAELVDRAALARLVASISRFLDPQQAVAASAAGAQIEVLDSRRLGGGWLLDRLWQRLGVDAALRRVAGSRRLDGDAAERVLFALVAQRALEPGSKLAATRWVAQRVVIEGCVGLTDDAAYRAMDFLLAGLGEIASEIFASVAHLLNLDLDIVFETPPPPTGTSRSPTNWPTSTMIPTPTTGCAHPPRTGHAGSAIPRTTARTCRRW